MTPGWVTSLLDPLLCSGGRCPAGRLCRPLFPVFSLCCRWVFMVGHAAATSDETSGLEPYFWPLFFWQVLGEAFVAWQQSQGSSAASSSVV